MELGPIEAEEVPYIETSTSTGTIKYGPELSSKAGHISLIHIDQNKVRRLMTCQQCGTKFSGNPGAYFCTETCEEDFDKEKIRKWGTGAYAPYKSLKPKCDGCGERMKAKKLTRVKCMDGEFRKFCSHKCETAYQKGQGYQKLWLQSETTVPNIRDFAGRGKVLEEGYGDHTHHRHEDGVLCDCKGEYVPEGKEVNLVSLEPGRPAKIQWVKNTAYCMAFTTWGLGLAVIIKLFLV